MIKQILFDCGGVLTEMHFKKKMFEISNSQQVADYFIDHIWSENSPWHRYDRGEIDTDEVLVQLKEFMPKPYHGFLETFVKNWLDALPPNPEMPKIVDEIKQNGLGCFLLSNFPQCFEEMPQRVPVLKKFDGLLPSYKVHLLKPDPAFYLSAVKAFGIKPEETLFVDDVPKNVEGAKAVGMSGYLFTTAEDFYDYLKQNYII